MLSDDHVHQSLYHGRREVGYHNLLVLLPRPKVRLACFRE